MRMKTRGKKLGIRVAALVVMLSLLVSLGAILPPSAYAVTSLSGIENITAQGSFSILEIVPETGTGSIGYYIGQQEPVANWMNELASLNAAARKPYVDDLFSALKSVGLMGTSGNNYPLTEIASYVEYLPWEVPAGTNVTEITLDHTEEKKVVGTFEENDAGGYVQANTYVYDSESGNFVENALYYVFGERIAASEEDVTYYYNIRFDRVLLTEENVESYLGIPLYVPVTDSGVHHYKYAGTLERGGNFTIDDDINEGVGYFTASVKPEQPVTKWEFVKEISVTADNVAGMLGKTLYILQDDAYIPVVVTDEFIKQNFGNGNDSEEGGNTGEGEGNEDNGAGAVAGNTVFYELPENSHSYFAILNPTQPYREAAGGEVGLFSQVVGYQYVGAGNANGRTTYAFTPDSSGTERNVLYNKIYITGGYSNNEWFKRYVLDMDGASSAELSGFRIILNSVTPDRLTSAMIQSAGMVVVSAGFDKNNGNTLAYTSDVNTALLTELKGKPRVVDGRITGAPNLLSLQDGTAAPAVTSKNVYNFTTGVAGSADYRSALATNQFYTPFTNKTPYQVVSDEIEYENFLRQGDTDNLLSTDISMATCIRYIINTHRTINKKTSLNVLDIQPASKYDGDTGPLSPQTVASWLPVDTQNALKKPDGSYNINITHMSTSALIAKIEDISEQFDLIYIGAHEMGFNLPDGLYYSNIGATSSVSTTYLNGLLTQGNNTARYSGNDLTPSKQAELIEFANAGLPVVVSGTLVSGSGSREASTLSVTLTSSDSTLTAVPTLSPQIQGVQFSYQWYRNGVPVSGETGSSIYASSGYTYRCAVTASVDGINRTAYSDTKRLSRTISKLEKHNGPTWNEWQDLGRYYDGHVTENNANHQVTVSVSNMYGGNVTGAQYQWYRGTDYASRVRNATSSTYTIPEDGQYYYCQITFGSGYRKTTVKSPAYKVTVGSASFETIAPYASTAEIPAVTAGSYAIDPDRVDANSLMYKALDSIWGRENVMVQTSLEAGKDNSKLNDNQDTLVKYLNLSRPSINLSATPKTYNGLRNTTGNVVDLNAYDCGGNLSYTFTIQNPTDPDPANTRYACYLYVDQNGDGRHNAEERIGDLYIGEVGSTGTSVINNGELREGATYTLQRTLNRTQFSGIVAWKLQVVKVGESTVHASEKGYAYIQPASPTVINVLQIRPGGGSGIDLSSNTKFTGLYAELEAANAYDINLTTTTVNTLNNKTSADDVFNILDQYNMIIIGFGDMYGDLNENAAKAVVRYIETGKAVLFTHDTTSFYNKNSSSAWGYYFNQYIRDKVGLDRYGVTNTTFKSSVAAGSNGKISSATAQSLWDAGYTVGYEPKSSMQSTAYTQGYTNLTIKRYKSGQASPTTTTKVSQVNRGQITEFPYKIGDLDIATTHDQYYQLNMNADDIAVWYCLSGTNYANYRNDATNVYYIYNRGNITYSGAGHNTNLTSDEAMLFVNTMVAAYRAANNPPTVEFRTENDYPVTTQLVPVEYSGEGNTQGLGAEQMIFFKIQDTNLAANKTIAVELYYDSDAEDAVEDPTLKNPGMPIESPAPKVKKAEIGQIHRVDNGAVASRTMLNSNVLYEMMIPQEILESFAASDDAETKIYIKATTSILSSAYVASGSDDLTLKKIGLLRLE